MHRAWLVLLVVLAGIAVVSVYWALLFVSQRSMMFPAPPVPSGRARPPDAQTIWLETSAGRVEAWYLAPFGHCASRTPLLVFTHGNGELIDDWPAAFSEPRTWCMGVLLVEYPGYGRSRGRPSQRSITEVMLAADRWARANPALDADRIIPYGRSLGGGAAAILATERPVPALILESSFTSARAFARQFGAPGFLVRDPFDTLGAVRRFKGPVLVLHGDRDDIVPVDHGRALAAASPGATLRVLHCGHNDCPRAWSVIRSFLLAHDLLPQPGNRH